MDVSIGLEAEHRSRVFQVPSAVMTPSVMLVRIQARQGGPGPGHMDEEEKVEISLRYGAIEGSMQDIGGSKLLGTFCTSGPRPQARSDC